MKRALVTGASGGIGLVFATELSKLGYSITAVARNENQLTEAIKSFTGGGHKSLKADLSQAGDIKKISDEITTNKYDLVVNNAGIGVYGMFEEIPLEKTEAMLHLNIDAVVSLSHAFLKTAKQGDALINVASMIGINTFPSASAYSGTKAFVVGFTEGLWYEQKKKGVYVMALLPGVTSTNFHTNAGGTAANEPPKSIEQTPEEVVAEALAALKKRSEPVVITGIKNRMIRGITKLLSRKTVVNMMGGQVKQPN